jgi:murein DD-endopeptidase MepM/ murein hydrolase activator NlpD
MLNKPGWLVATEALGSNPNDHTGGNYTQWTQLGFSVIARLNNGYHPVGTIPQPNEYEDFARRCANFAAATPGITMVIIGNEPNHKNERPYEQPITPIQYAKCFDLCYQRIHDAVPTMQVATSAVAPWDATTKYPGNESGDWVQYWIEMLNAIKKTDAITLHTYTHGTDPNLITDMQRMDPPFQAYHYHFSAYIDFMDRMPTRFRYLPVYITETDQVIPWADQNSGWVQEAYNEIDYWNHNNAQKIHCLALYRSNKDDMWSFTDKQGVINDFKEAVQAGHRFPLTDIPTPHPPTPQPPDPTPPSPPQPDPTPSDVRDIDPALIGRGVKFETITPPPDVWYWKMVKAQWMENAAATVGPDHHILGRVLQGGAEQPGVRLEVTWPSGSTNITSKRNEPQALYNYDFPMSSSLNEYSIRVADAPSDKVTGIGMGKNGNPSEHTSTWITFEWTQSQGTVTPPVEPPIIVPVPEDLCHPLLGSIITQHFYQNPQNYRQFNLPGHNGTDFGGKSSRTPVLNIAKGVVAFVGNDVAYGNYVRVKHQEGWFRCYTFFAHLDSISVAAGQVIEASVEIGKLGTTGNSTGVHLHLEVRLMLQDGTYLEGTPMPKGRVDPQSFFIERGLKL